MTNNGELNTEGITLIFVTGGAHIGFTLGMENIQKSPPVPVEAVQNSVSGLI